LQYRTALYETSNLTLIPKIRAINELLDLYDRRDSIITLKKALSGSVVNTEVGEFEREKLLIDRKALFENIVYYVKAEDFNAEKLKKFLVSGNFDLISALPSRPEGDKVVVTVNCRVQVSKAPNKKGFSYDWIADLVLSDAFNENTVLYSKTAAGDEEGGDDNDGRAKAMMSAEAEMNRMAEEFFKSVN
jgi:hypothetical protein